MKLALLLLVVITLAAPTPANPEIEKVAEACEKGICLHWWPRLPLVEGWHQDPEASKHYSVNAQAPDGQTFYDSEVVIYAKAVYKPRTPDTKSLEKLIADDKTAFLDADPEIVMAEVDPLRPPTESL